MGDSLLPLHCIDRRSFCHPRRGASRRGIGERCAWGGVEKNVFRSLSKNLIVLALLAWPLVGEATAQDPPLIGSDIERVQAALGEPDRIAQDAEQGVEFYYFGDSVVVVGNGKVLAVSDEERLKKKLAAQAPLVKTEDLGPESAPPPWLSAWEKERPLSLRALGDLLHEDQEPQGAAEIK